MSTLARHVSVRDDVGAIHTFGPEDEIPEWAAREITNPAAWEGGDVPFPAKPSKSGGAPATASVSAVPTEDLEDRIVARVVDGVGALLRDMLVVVDAEDEDSASTGSEADPPPRAGKGSGEDKWRAYAAEKGVDVSHIEDRNEIIAFLEDQGVRVE
ncbi:hypothetical protein [Mycolicibacterium peregrinum]|uniref:Uncharacterized protein n=1 Tax=Mycolicibacterium peregrinum TaxID=43304 RepID=A0A4Z0HNM7_MYCPR|nr:hypothetical protein [Mycolicibacterium peregrinum]TGB37878.1 hypothetical protein EJD98_25345 [Mycolicibacterium peregrinum]TGB38103.1 hypothetical protein EJD94_25220 [Mycolicibacterium peregrinum]